MGHLAYLLESLRTLPENMSQSIPLKISAENFSEEGEYIFGAVSNSYSVAGFSGLPGQNLQEKMNIDLADGEFEVLLIRSPKNIGELGEIVGTLLRGDIPEDHPYVSFLKPVIWSFMGKSRWNGLWTESTGVPIRQEISKYIKRQQELCFLK